MKPEKEILLILTAVFVQTLLLAAIGNGTAAKARCADHLRGLFQASSLYAQASGDSFPPVIARGPDRRWHYWPEYLRDHVTDVRFFSCPEDPKGGREQLERQDDLLPPGFALRYVSYGMNFLLGVNISSNPKGRREYLVHQVREPGYVIFLGDSKTMELRPTSCWNQDYAPVHDNGSNFLMADGHVEWLNRKTLGLGWQARNGWKLDRKRWVNWK